MAGVSVQVRGDTLVAGVSVQVRGQSTVFESEFADQLFTRYSGKPIEILMEEGRRGPADSNSHVHSLCLRPKRT